MKRKYILLFSLLVLAFTTSCDDDDNYQTRMEDERKERSRYLEDNGITKANLLEEGIYYQELKTPENTDAPKVEVGDEVVVYYTGYLLNGLVFNTNVLRGKYEPRTIRIQNTFRAQIIVEGSAVKEVIRGWVPALLQMRTGTKARVVIPSNMAFGFYGTSNPQDTFVYIPGYTTIVYEIEVAEVRKKI